MGIFDDLKKWAHPYEDEDEEAALEEQAAVEGGEEAQGGDTVSESSAS